MFQIYMLPKVFWHLLKDLKEMWVEQICLRSFCFLILVFTFCHCKEAREYTDSFHENLFIKPLSTGHIYTHFQFKIQKELDSSSERSFNHFRLFPRSLGEIIFENDVHELHFSLTQGLWRYEKWGYPVRSAPPGAELWALFKGNDSDITSNWKRLTHVLSGQFCASLNFIDESNTAIPKLSFRPEGVIPNSQPFNSSFVRYAALPREIVCTENLTPFRKLLPCGAQAGLSTLLHALNIFKAHYVSLAIDVQTVCRDDCSKVALELIQSVSIVFDPPVSQSRDWSFAKLFGSSLTSTCPVATGSNVFVDISSNNTAETFALKPPAFTVKENIKFHGSSTYKTTYAIFDLKNIFKDTNFVNVASQYEHPHIYGIVPPPPLYAIRKISGYGQEQGGIHCSFFNNDPKHSLKIVYFDVIPWYLRLYSHTLQIRSSGKIISPDYLHYQPAKDRSRPHHLEIVLTLPPKSKTEMTIDFDFAFLKWTEYPPDANHGFYVGSAVISAVLGACQNCSMFPEFKDSVRSDKGHFLRVHTQILLVSLPTPDFSMPYNVICLTCTVVALAFGPIHNITTKSFQPLDEEKNKTFFGKIKDKVKKWWNKNKDSTDKPDGESKKTS